MKCNIQAREKLTKVKQKRSPLNLMFCSFIFFIPVPECKCYFLHASNWQRVCTCNCTHHLEKTAVYM